MPERTVVTIRPFVPQDASQVAQVFFESVRALGLGPYSPKQVAAWAPESPDARGIAARAADGRVFLVAVDRRGAVVAYGDLERDGHIDQLYCHPSVARSGVATLIYLALEDAARTIGLGRLYVEASEVALPFFKHHGFAMLLRQNVERRGVLLHNYRMVKALQDSSSALQGGP